MYRYIIHTSLFFGYDVSGWTCICHHIPASQAEDVRFVIDGTGVQEMLVGFSDGRFAHGSDLYQISCMQIWVRHTL